MWIAVAGIMFAAACALAQPQAATLYVATNGNDAWSGKLPEPNAEKRDGPLATIAKARDVVRQLKGSGALPKGATIQIKGGTYLLAEPITFTPQDSGDKEYPISYVAYPGETPILCGGRRIEGLQPEKGGIYSAMLPEVKEGKWYFRQLFVDGERQVRARYPNVDPSDPYRKGFLYVDKVVSGFGMGVGCIHNPGDWMEYDVTIPADGEYRCWIYYGALNKPHGNVDMAGRTVLSVDGGQPIPLMNLPDTGGWGEMKWSHSATLHLKGGAHILRWQNITGGGLNLDAFALTDDDSWKPVGAKLPQTAAGKHLVIIQAEDFQKSQSKQLAISGASGSKTQFYAKPRSVKSAWAKAPDAELHIFQSGSCRAFKEICSIVDINAETGLVNMGGKECVAPIGLGDRYFVENIREELDSPGEWYLDRQTGRLSYWPKRGFYEKSELIAPVLGRMIVFEGDGANKNPVSHIRLAGLAIQDTDYSPEDGCVGYGMGNDGVVFMQGAADCAVENCRFTNIGKYAVCLLKSEGVQIVSNEISHSAEGGVLLLDSARNTVSDNHIHHCGAVYKHIGGIVLQGKDAGENTISHNLIHDMSRYGISLKNAGLKNIIEYNEVRNTNTETYDTGGIEVTQQDRELRSGSVIRYNLVADTIGYSSKREEPVFMSWGIYLDSFAGGYTVTNNVTFRNSHGGVMLQGGKDNIVENNILVDSTIAQVYVNNFSNNSTGQVFERNLVSYSAPDAFLISAGRVDSGVIRADCNLYFLAGGGEIKVRGPGMASFADWQKKGLDANSAIADPGFVDPAKDDYRLKPDSPAFKLGFQPIPIEKIGRRAK
ncbi:MAG: right-handed parallel beta-helix repeat-containing protein [Planctomycetota bacterium]